MRQYEPELMLVDLPDEPPRIGAGPIVLATLPALGAAAAALAHMPVVAILLGIAAVVLFVLVWRRRRRLLAR